MNCFYSDRFGHISSKDRIQKPVGLGQRGPVGTDAHHVHLGKRTENISYFLGKKIAFSIFTEFTRCAGAAVRSCIRDFLVGFRVACLFIYLFIFFFSFHFCLCTKETVVKYTQRLISSLWTEKLNRY